MKTSTGQEWTFKTIINLTFIFNYSVKMNSKQL